MNSIAPFIWEFQYQRCAITEFVQSKSARQPYREGCWYPSLWASQMTPNDLRYSSEAMLVALRYSGRTQVHTSSCDKCSLYAVIKLPCGIARN